MAHFSFVSFMTVAASSALLLTAVLTLAACADDPVTPGPKGDSGVPTFEDAGGVAMDSSRPDQEAGPADPVVNGCMTYLDRTDTAAPRTLQWDLVVGNLPDRCMRIKAGQSMKFVDGAAVANFVAHPLTSYVPNGGGIGPAVNTTSGELTFPAAGLFGFGCDIHPQMNGAVIVE